MFPVLWIGIIDPQRKKYKDTPEIWGFALFIKPFLTIFSKMFGSRSTAIFNKNRQILATQKLDFP